MTGQPATRPIEIAGVLSAMIAQDPPAYLAGVEVDRAGRELFAFAAKASDGRVATVTA